MHHRFLMFRNRKLALKIPHLTRLSFVLSFFLFDRRIPWRWTHRTSPTASPRARAKWVVAYSDIFSWAVVTGQRFRSNTAGQVAARRAQKKLGTCFFIFFFQSGFFFLVPFFVCVCVCVLSCLVATPDPANKGGSCVCLCMCTHVDDCLKHSSPSFGNWILGKDSPVAVGLEWAQERRNAGTMSYSSPMERGIEWEGGKWETIPAHCCLCSKAIYLYLQFLCRRKTKKKFQWWGRRTGGGRKATAV